MAAIARVGQKAANAKPFSPKEQPFLPFFMCMIEALRVALEGALALGH